MTTTSESPRLIQILLVEDSPADVELTREALADVKVANTLHLAEDGVDAMAFIRREGRFLEAPRPDLIILDLNLPRKDGREVLAELKADDDLKRIPIVVLTTSDADRDVLTAYDRHVNAYIRKPVDLDQFVEVVRAIPSFWLGIVTLPPEGALSAEKV